MKVRLNFNLPGPITLPIQYNHILQAIVLGWLSDENYQRFIHDEGYKYNKRIYKGYTFSRLMGSKKINKEHKTITFYNEMSFILASVDDKFLQYIVNTVILNQELFFYRQPVKIKNIEVIKEEVTNKMIIYTASPITTYTTFEANNKKKTYYYTPYEEEFNEQLRQNLIRKYHAFYDNYPENDEFLINPKKETLKKSVLVYKGFVIHGWNGEFEIEGNKELIKIALDTGLGSKNSIGLGCIILK